MECIFSKRNSIVSAVLTVVAFVACYFISEPEKATSNAGWLAVYSAIIGVAIGFIGEGVNYLSQTPKNTSWMAILGGLAAGLLASAI